MTADLPQPVEQLHLLLAEVQRLVHHQPGDRLPAARVGGAPLVMTVRGVMTMMTVTHLVCDIVPRVGQEAGQGELVHTCRVPSVLHLETILSFSQVIIITWVSLDTSLWRLEGVAPGSGVSPLSCSITATPTTPPGCSCA